MKGERFLASCNTLGLCCVLVFILAAGEIPARQVIFSDDFSSTAIDTSKWVFNPNGVGGSVTQSGGYLDWSGSGTTPYQAVRTAVNLQRRNLLITLDINPVSVAPNKNVGFWLGQIDGFGDYTGYGYFVGFNSTGSFVEVNKWAGGPGSAGVVGNVGGISMNTWYRMEVVKEGSSISFFIVVGTNRTFIGRDTNYALNSLYWSTGRPWNENRSGEDGNVLYDNLRVVTGEEYLLVKHVDQLTNGNCDTCPDYSADGSQIVLSRGWSYTGGGPGGSIYRMNSDGTSVTLLRLSPGGRDYGHAAWRPDAQRIVYSDEQVPTFDLICIRASDGAGPHTITPVAGDGRYPDFRPDGKKIIYATGNGTIHVADYVTTESPVHTCALYNDTAITPSGCPGTPRWSPDGQRIAFASGAPSHICVMKPDGSEWRQLTFGAWSDIQPVWSPDGSFLSFCSQRPPSTGWDMWVVRSDGTGLQHVASVNTDGVAKTDWHPDGSKIIYHGNTGPAYQLFVARVQEVALPDCSALRVAGYWPFEGNADDYSGNGNHATTITATQANGRFGQAYRFNGVADGMFIPDTPSLSPSLITISLWARFDTAAAQTLCYKGDLTTNPGTSWDFHIVGGKVSWSVYSGGSALGLVSTATLQLGQIYHLAGVYDGRESRIYVNGVVDCAGLFAGPLNDTSFPVVLGKRQDGSEPLQGMLDDVVILNRALSALEMRMLASDGNANGVADFWEREEKVLFVSARDGNNEIYVMNPDGSGQTRLTNTPTLEESFAYWSPDGGKIVFQCQPTSGGIGEIYVANPDGCGGHNLTNTPGESEGAPDWSPDETIVVYHRNYGTTESAICVMIADGTSQTRRTFGTEDKYPSWAPGGRILFLRAMAPGQPLRYERVFVMNADGTNVQRLTPDNDGWEAAPAWSPDGTRIVFTSTRNTNWWRDQIWVMNSDGTSPTSVTSNAWRHAMPRWSPNGQRIVYCRAPYDTSNYDIWVMNADGTSPTQLTNTGGIPNNFPHWTALAPALPLPPLAPSNISPFSGATSVTLTPTLVSSPFADPDTSHTHAASQWQISTASDFSSSPPLVWDSDRTTANLIYVTLPAGVLQLSATFYWRVCHQDDTGTWSNWSNPTSFTTKKSPAPPCFYVDCDATGANNGSSWANAFTAIQPAIDAASLRGGGEVWVAEGTYGENRIDEHGSVVMKPGVHLYGGFIGNGPGGNETLRSQRNWKTHATVIDGATARGGAAAKHVIKGANDATMDGFTIRGGRATDPVWEHKSGGGMFNWGASPVVADCTFTDNMIVEGTSSGGGAVYNGSYSNPKFINCVFSGNQASGGGAMASQGYSAPDVIDCTFTNNHSSGAAGALYGAGNGTYTNCVFTSNTAATNGGAVFSHWGDSPTFISCIFAWNQSGTEGSAVVFGLGLQVLKNCTISGNTSGNGGGAVNCGDDASLMINCIVWGNTGGNVNAVIPIALTASYSDIQDGFAGTGNINADPLFANAARGDFHLRFGSPCIDTGTSSGAPATDIEGKPRPQDIPGVGADGPGVAFDMGAYEYATLPNTPTNLLPPNAATGVALTPTLHSSPFSDPDTSDTHAASQWQIATANDFSSSPPLVWDSGASATDLTSVSVPASVLHYATVYFWRVRHQDSLGLWSSWSAPTFFLTAGAIGLPPRIQSATVSDVNNNGVIQPGDQLVLTMDRSVVVTTHVLQASHFFLPVVGDDLGRQNFSVRVNRLNSRQIVLMLGGPDVHLATSGTFSMTRLTPGSPSGIDFATSLPLGAIVSLDGVPAVDGGVAGVDDSGVDIELSLIGRSGRLGVAGGVLSVVPSLQAAYTSHALDIPPGALTAMTSFTLRPPIENLGVINAFQIESSSPTITFRVPVTVRVEYREGDIDWERGQVEWEMHVHQLVERPLGVFQYVVVPGQHIIESAAPLERAFGAVGKLYATPHRVSVQVLSLNPCDTLTTPGLFAGLPIETVDERTIVIGPSGGGDGMVGGAGPAVLIPGPQSAYPWHRIEFPGYVETGTTDPARLVVKMRTAKLAERWSLTGGQSFPAQSGAVFTVTVVDASSQPIHFTSPVHLTVQFKERPNPAQTDAVYFNGQLAAASNMRLVWDQFPGEPVDFVFADAPSQIVDATSGTVTAQNYVGLTSTDGKGTWGAVARTLSTRAARWQLYR